MIKIRAGQKIHGDSKSFVIPSKSINGPAIKRVRDPVTEKTTRMISS